MRMVAQANTACGIETMLLGLLGIVPAIAQANTACGIETPKKNGSCNQTTELHRRIPLAVYAPPQREFFQTFKKRLRTYFVRSLFLRALLLFPTSCRYIGDICHLAILGKERSTSYA